MADPKQNGFFKGTESFEPVNVGTVDGDQNPKFLWPSNQYQVYNGRQLESKTLVRGYIRSLLGDKGGLFGAKITGIGGRGGSSTTPPSTNSRLNFQFNPELIVRDVSRSDGAINPLLTDPINLTQPVPGTATFSFSMTFNREAEVAMGASMRANSKVTVNATNAAHLQGVMADIKVLDSIIGQGIDKKTIDTLLKYTQQSIITQNNTINAANTAGAANTPGFVATPTIADITSEADLKNNLDNNSGNQAFLNPLPVRIVFSEFLMVEGFVTSTAVAFQKFSPEMIPTIAQVNCVVQALYFGFAKEKAFLTDNLKNFGSAQSTITNTPSAPIVVNTALQNALNNLKLKAKIRPNYYIANLVTVGDNVSNYQEYYDGSINMKSWNTPSDTNSGDAAKWAQGPYGAGEQYPGSNNKTISFHQVYNIFNTDCFTGVNDIDLLNRTTTIQLFNFDNSNQPANNGQMPCLIEFNPISKSAVDTTLNKSLEIFFEIKVLLSLEQSGKNVKNNIPMNDISENKYSSLLYQSSVSYKGFTQCFLNFNGLITYFGGKPPILKAYFTSGLTNYVRNYATATDTFVLTYIVKPYIMQGQSRVVGKEKKAVVRYPWTYDGNTLYRDNSLGQDTIIEEVEFT